MGNQRVVKCSISSIFKQVGLFNLDINRIIMKMVIHFPHHSPQNTSIPSPLIKLIITLTILLSLTTQSKITQLSTKIINPSMMDACRDGQSLIISNNQQIQIIKINETGTFQTSYDFAWKIHLVKCLRENVFAIALQGLFCILEKGSQMKCDNYTGKPFSITQNGSDSSIYLFVKNAENQYEELVYKNGKFSQESIEIQESQHYAMGEYVGDHNYIYLPSTVNHQKINYWKTPFDEIKQQSIIIQKSYPIKSMTSLLGTDSVLISNNNGDFSLIKSNSFILDWTDTLYNKGCLCTKQIVVLSNSQKLIIYNYDQIQIFQGFNVKGDLVEIQCVNRAEQFRLFLLGSQNNIILINLEKDGSGMTFYIILFLLFIIAGAVIKLLFFNLKESPQPVTDEGGNYRELGDITRKDGIEDFNKQ